MWCSTFIQSTTVAENESFRNVVSPPSQSGMNPPRRVPSAVLILRAEIAENLVHIPYSIRPGLDCDRRWYASRCYSRISTWPAIFDFPVWMQLCNLKPEQCNGQQTVQLVVLQRPVGRRLYAAHALK